MIINADGTDEQALTAGSYPAWSPDGTEILYLHSGLNAIQPDGSAQRLVTLGWDDRNPSWSPDGQSIVFSRNGPNGKAIYVSDRRGNNLRLISSGTTDVNPNWK